MTLPMTPTITAFERSPDRGRGLARDMRVRWALEEVGQPYEVRLVSFGAMKEPAHRALHPFGQIPTYEEGDLTLFEYLREYRHRFAFQVHHSVASPILQPLLLRRIQVSIRTESTITPCQAFAP